MNNETAPNEASPFSLLDEVERRLERRHLACREDCVPDLVDFLSLAANTAGRRSW